MALVIGHGAMTGQGCNSHCLLNVNAEPFIGGTFIDTSPTPPSHWTPAAAQLGGEGYIFSLAVWNGALYGGTGSTGRLYRYDVGVGWTQVAAKLGVEIQIRSLAVWNGALYGGTYPSGNLYRYDVGIGWVQVAAQLGAEDTAYSLAVWNGALYGGTGNTGRLYRYDVGIGWVEVAAQLGGQIYIFSLAVWNGVLYGGTAQNGRLFRYDVGIGWVQVAAQLGAEIQIRSLAVWNGTLYGGTASASNLYQFSTSGRVVTNSGVTQSAAQVKFGSKSILTDADADILSVANDSRWSFSGDFSVSAWVYLTGPIGKELFSHYATIPKGWAVIAGNGLNQAQFRGYVAGVLSMVADGPPLIANAWAYVEHGRRESKLYAAGALADSTAGGVLDNSGTALRTSQGYSQSMFGCRDAMRITSNGFVFDRVHDPQTRRY